jgi:DNA (cytosine-5)-methyltransferase 1
MEITVDDVVVRPLNILSLCAGVGGLELGISLALGHLGATGRGVCYVERETAAAASLVASMEAGWLHPAPVWSDMLTFDGRPWRGLVHILASGDPCQDNSVAGKRAGSAGSRFLAPEVCRIAAECGPDLVFRENVPGNADEQLAAIVPALERLGYRVAAGIFSSTETGNTMRRERLFIMAISDGGIAGNGDLQRGRELGLHPQNDGDSRYAVRCGEEVAGTSGTGPQGRERSGAPRSVERFPTPRPASQLRRTLLPPAVIPGPDDTAGWRDVLDRFPELQPALSQEEAESHLRRGIDAMAHRVERLRATGNGVDPVVAAYAFLALRARLQRSDAEAEGIVR